MIIPIIETLSSSGIQNAANRFKGRPTGIVIEDSFNNLAFPLPFPVIDTNKQNLSLIIRQYLNLYNNDNFNKALPWHYVIEFSDRGYVIYNTRPMDLMYPYTTSEVLTLNKPILNDDTKHFLNSSRELQTMIHVLLIGDSTKDVYTKQLYQTINDFIIGPICRNIKVSPTIGTSIFPLNLGDRFINNILYSTFR